MLKTMLFVINKITSKNFLWGKYKFFEDIYQIAYANQKKAVGSVMVENQYITFTITQINQDLTSEQFIVTKNQLNDGINRFINCMKGN